MLLAACVEPPVEPTPLVEPTMQVTAPLPGAAVSGDTLTIRLEVTDFVFTSIDEEVASSMPPAGWTWLITGAWAHDPGDAPNGYASLEVDGVEIARALSPDIFLDIRALEPGTHSLRVELVYPDGDAFFPAVADQIWLERL